MTGSAHVIRANSRSLPLGDDSVDLVVTSPPYFALRSYQDGGEHYAGQIGDEPTPAAFVDSLLEVTRECMRVLKPSGSLWLNLGDKYAGSQPSASRWHTASLDGGRGRLPELAESQAGVADTDWGTVRPKSLMGIPWRYALRCIDELGLILRAEIIWSKPNGLPESVTDRVRRSHEQWFHLTLNPRYYSAVDEIREPHADPSDALRPRLGKGQHSGPIDGGIGKDTGGNPLGKLPGSVWVVPTEPLKVPAELGIDHFAAFPTEFPRRIIQGWSPAGVCTACGEGRRPVVLTDLGRKERDTPAYGAGNHGTGGSTLGSRGSSARILGYACACTPSHVEDDGLGAVVVYDWHLWTNPPPTTPGVVLDPFGGTGTTALVAKALGRHGISVDMSADYCRLATWRTNDPDQLAKAMRVDKPAKQVDGQISMLDLLGEEPA